MLGVTKIIFLSIPKIFFKFKMSFFSIEISGCVNNKNLLFTLLNKKFDALLNPIFLFEK